MINPSILKDTPLFAALDSATCEALAQRAFTRDYRAGQTPVLEGLPAKFCYFLLSGEVRVFRMNLEGRVQVLARLKPITPFNVISLLVDQRLNHASVETLTPVSLLVLDASDFDTLLGRYPDFSKMLLKIFAQRMALITDLAADLSLYTVRSRLARFLIELADRRESSSGWTQDEIAAHIGTVRDVVGRLLREFEEWGLIKRDRQEITLIDRKGLYEEAQVPHP